MFIPRLTKIIFMKNDKVIRLAVSEMDIVTKVL